MAVDDTEVGIRHLETDVARGCHVTQKDACAMLLIIVEREFELLVEEIGVETIVLLEGLFPGHLRIVLAALLITGREQTVVDTEVVGIAAAGRHLLVIAERIGEIHEAVTTYLVVTYETPRGAELEEVDDRCDGLPEFLVADHPAY